MRVIHPHFHGRHTGVTSHVAAVVKALGPMAAWTGQLLPAELPREEVTAALTLSKTEDVIWHAHRNNELLVGLGLRQARPRLKVVFTRHAATAPSAFTRWLGAQADAVITLSAQGAALWPGPSTVVPHGVDTARFVPPPEGRAAAWRALGLPGARGLGVVGRVRPDKGQADFAEALTPMPPGWRGVVVGLAQDAAFASSVAAREGLSLVGEQADVVPWLQGFTVLVNPSHQESFGLTLLEGMAAGCCVVASALPHVPAIIEHGKTGVLFEPGNPRALREALEPLLREPERAEALGRAAVEAARARFGIEQEAQALRAVYERVVAAG
jgi:mannosyltransferase